MIVWIEALPRQWGDDTQVFVQKVNLTSGASQKIIAHPVIHGSNFFGGSWAEDLGLYSSFWLVGKSCVVSVFNEHGDSKVVAVALPGTFRALTGWILDEKTMALQMYIEEGLYGNTTWNYGLLNVASNSVTIANNSTLVVDLSNEGMFWMFPDRSAVFGLFTETNEDGYSEAHLWTYNFTSATQSFSQLPYNLSHGYVIGNVVGVVHY